MFYTDEIVQMRDKFWQDKLTKLTTDVMIKQYVSTYLDLLSHDDSVLPLDALGRLDSLDNFLGQKIEMPKRESENYITRGLRNTETIAEPEVKEPEEDTEVPAFLRRQMKQQG